MSKSSNKVQKGSEVWMQMNSLGGLKEGQRVIVTDVDSVLIDITTPMNEWIMNEYGVPVELRDWIHWDLGESFGIPEEDSERLWEAFSTMNSKPYEGAIDFIHDLKSRGYYVIGLSKRGGKLLEQGKKDFQCLPLDEIHINKGNKGLYAIQNLVIDPNLFDFFIDDKVGNLRDMFAEYPLVNLLLMDQPWNASFDIDPIYDRLYSYQGILAFVDEAEKQEITEAPRSMCVRTSEDFVVGG